MQSILIASCRKNKSAPNLLRMSLQVVRHIAEGMVAFLLERHDHAKPIMRSVARELLSSCVLRSIMTFFCPYTVNKARSTSLLIPFSTSQVPSSALHGRCRWLHWHSVLLARRVSRRKGLSLPPVVCR